MQLYLAGPMSGKPWCNFPTFDYWAERLRALGHVVVSPAEIDREEGIEPREDGDISKMPAFLSRQREVALRDVQAIAAADAVAVLPDWHKSVGTNAELTFARWIGVPALDVRTMKPLEDSETILEEAQRLVYGARNEAYGHPLDDFARTAQIWGAILGTQVTAEQVAMCMVGVKLSRECNKPQRDNAVDGAGYLACLQRVREERARREEQKRVTVHIDLPSSGAQAEWAALGEAAAAAE